MTRVFFFLLIVALTVPMMASDYDKYVRNSKGSKYAETGQLGKAHEIYAEAVEAYPEDFVLLSNFAHVLFREGEYDRAQEVYEEAMKYANSDQARQTMYNLGNVFVKQGNAAQAMDAYKSVLLQDPDHQNARINLELVLQALKNSQQQPESGQDHDQEPESEHEEQQSSQNQEAEAAQDPEDEELRRKLEQELKEAREQEAKKQEEKRRNAEQILESLEDRERDIRNDYLKRLQRNQLQVEKDW